MSREQRLQKIQEWAKDLVDLSRRNRLLYFKHPKSGSLEFEQTASEIIRGLGGSGAREGWGFHLPPPPPPEDEESPPYEPLLPESDELVTAAHLDRFGAEIERSLQNLLRRSTSEYLDTGLWVLFLGLGSLTWHDGDQQALSPLWLHPVRLDRRSGGRGWRLLPNPDAEAVLNPALAVKLKDDYGITLPSFEDFNEPEFSEVRDAVQQAVNSRGWVVDDRVVLSYFTFQKEVIYQDLLANQDQIADSPLVELLIEGPATSVLGDLHFDPVDFEDLDERHPPENLNLILDADGSQRQCVLAALEGHSFVMDGPPGTGKSQTIANLIAALMAKGKSVLFVSEKAAALEVVYNRLKERGLQHFLFDLHSRKLSRKAVAAELSQALTLRPRATDKWTASKAARLTERRRDLNQYAIAMNRVREPFGLNLHNAVGRVSELQGLATTPAIEVSATGQTMQFFNQLRDYAERLGQAWEPVTRGQEFLWRDLRNPSTDQKRQSELVDCLNELQEALEGLRARCLFVEDDLQLSETTGPAEAQELLRLLELVEQRVTAPAEWLSHAEFEDSKNELVGLANNLETHATQVSEFQLEVPGWEQLDPDALQRVEALLEEVRSLLVDQGPEAETLARAGVCSHCGEAVGSTTKFCGKCGASITDIPADVPEPQLLWGNELEQLTQELRHAAQALDAAWSGAENLKAAFQVRGPLTLEQANLLVELASLAQRPHLPESTWFSSGFEHRVSSAIDALEEATDSYNSAKTSASSTFTEAAFDLDLEGLRARFNLKHRGLKKLSSRYREDKKLLAAGVIGGVVRKEAITKINDAIRWKETSTELQIAEQQHASILGSYYSSRDTADFLVAREALRTLQDTKSVAAGQVDVAVLQRHLSRDSGTIDLQEFEQNLRLALGLLEGNITQWLQAAKQPDGPLSLPEISRWLQELSERFEKLAAEHSPVREATRTRNDRPLRAVTEHLAIVGDIRTLEAQIQAVRGPRETEFGAFENAPTPEQIRLAVDWVEDVRGHFGGPVRERTAQLLGLSPLTPTDLEPTTGRFTSALESFVGEFTEQHANGIAQGLRSDFTSAGELISELRTSVSEIDEWMTYTEMTNRLTDMGVGAVVKSCVRQQVDGGDVADILEREFLRSWVDETLDADDSFKDRRSQDRDAIAAQFRELDRELIQNAGAKIIDACNNQRPENDLFQAGQIRQQGELKRGHRQVKQQLSQANEVVKTLKPCFMMSPLSASQFLPSSMTFDVVVFDEASQVREADAVGCIYRATQLIIAGDQKQLPPTSFWDRASEIEEEDQDEDFPDYDFESVLDRCKAQGFRSLSLDWHYRSQHEDLITYSNHSFYGGRLQTFPGATFEAPDLGVELRKVDGTYLRGGARTNPIEAEEVIDRVIFHRQHHPELTIGCVAFSAAQQVAIEAALDRRVEEVPELQELVSDDRLGGFFIKNLESVQGDERDIIIFSIGYGPDENGKLTMNFGPLNRAGGERRLNVAVTRARRRVEVISSISAGQINSQSASINHLRRYLDFAERGPQALAIDFSGSVGDVESVFEEQVITAIRQLGYEAVPQVGVAGYRLDIGVRAEHLPGSFVLGVECDGASYHSSYVARDRDRIRQQVLEGLGWRLHRIWSTAWFSNPGQEIERLRVVIEDAAAGRPSAEIPGSGPEPAVEVDLEEIDFSAPPEWLIGYLTPVAPAPFGSTGQWGTRDAQPAFVAQVRAVVAEYGPIHIDLCVDALKEAWGQSRVGATARRNVGEAINSVARRREVERRGDFLWPVEGTTIHVRGSRSASDPTRKIKHVAPEELDEATRRLFDGAHGQTGEVTDALVRRWRELFGWTRSSSEIQNQFRDSIDRVVDAGYLDGQ